MRAAARMTMRETMPLGRSGSLATLTCAYIFCALAPIPAGIGRPLAALIGTFVGLVAVADMVRCSWADGVIAAEGACSFGAAAALTVLATRMLSRATGLEATRSLVTGPVLGVGLGLDLAQDILRLVFAAALGILLVRRIPRPSWLLAAIMVGACADLFSALAPVGPTHVMIAARSQLLDYLLIRWPLTPLAPAVPILGVSDFAFVAIFHAAALKFGVPPNRSLTLLAAGMVGTVAVAGLVGLPLPVLPGLGLGCLLATWRAIRADLGLSDAR